MRVITQSSPGTEIELGYSWSNDECKGTNKTGMISPFPSALMRPQNLLFSLRLPPFYSTTRFTFPSPAALLSLVLSCTHARSLAASPVPASAGRSVHAPVQRLQPPPPPTPRSADSVCPSQVVVGGGGASDQSHSVTDFGKNCPSHRAKKHGARVTGGPFERLQSSKPTLSATFIAGKCILGKMRP